ncbi:cupin domain-containing protein [Pseudomonas marginalis]|jgi:mannose-6-phosphate isomerase-like protein (cupin superfamily)|uniref:cupin domain-containing protein n=1 Tax=Pseudomonas fluorescens group TaxID=136843 RepID=UPI001F37386B|nr:cupin domain-containing protein [Pseudomonas marginalis]MCF5668692.1 cupin [Pseudomonas marginalis]MCM2380177.1 cupin domain-containing protein [Pseudomonas marginalis]
MKIRRLVTGHNEQGHSVFVSDDLAPRAQSFSSIPGHGMAQIWSTPALPVLLAQGSDPTLALASLIPAQGGTSIALFDFPPDSVMHNLVDGVKAYAELSAALPGLIECFEPDSPGMHTTATIDYGVILEGEMWLELDNGESRLVKAGDIVIQNGTRHAWRNKSEHIARALFVMIGVTPSAQHLQGLP